MWLTNAKIKRPIRFDRIMFYPLPDITAFELAILIQCAIPGPYVEEKRIEMLRRGYEESPTIFRHLRYRETGELVKSFDEILSL